MINTKQNTLIKIIETKFMYKIENFFKQFNYLHNCINKLKKNPQNKSFKIYEKPVD